MEQQDNEKVHTYEDESCGSEDKWSINFKI